MKDKQDKWSKLINITDEYEGDPVVVERAINHINNSKSASKSRKAFPLKWLSIAACCIMVICISVFLPVYFSTPADVIYYSQDSLRYTEVNDIEQYRDENSLEFRCLADNVATSQVVSVKETGQIAYIVQDAFGVGQSGIDTIKIYIVLMRNAQFDFYRDYADAIENISVSDIEVSYLVRENENINSCFIKFSFESADYYMTISTNDEAIGKITQYVNILIN